ncbi:MAG TPA: succinylglutamate desuccinylase/aspartoacylase family protein, partial [Egibacteraceae bacterium]|nr:succinylglutamate desuccinylase/aspartoacylase family protein [Egibacteraceae bacterium]
MTDLHRRFDGYDELKPLLDGSDEDVLVALGKPTLIRIPGTDADPGARLVSCLLHGNEDSGYRAVLDLLRSSPRFGFDLWVLIGNVRAATHEGWFAHRYLDDQEDFNRVWGLDEPTTRMRRCADEVLAVLNEANLDGAIDLHNNTGQNPHYAILPRLTSATLSLGAACVDTALIWNMRVHTLMEQLVDRCPVVSMECGLPGVSENTAFAASALDCFLRLEQIDGAQRR